MSSELDQLQRWMDAKEDEHLEFKEAKDNFHFETLVKYCCALANELGGKMILGVTDKRPRKVVGTRAINNLERTKAGLIERLRLRIDVQEIEHPNGPVIVFHIPARPIGMPLQYNGAYWMRAGDVLAPMTPDMLQRIFAESGPDFSAEICLGARTADLDPRAVRALRELWLRKSGNEMLRSLSDEQLLADAELLIDGGVTYAALILLGTRQALGRYLAQAEVIFEYRSDEAAIPHQQRKEYRQGFLLFYDELWEAINLRNDVYHYQDGLFVWDILTFNEAVVREAVLNAVSHRDYRLAGSVFVRQSPRKLEIVSPGGFPPGITPENILSRQAPRNRRIAEVLAKCGLVERSGQGANRMFEESIRESKPLPDFSGSDDYQVALTLRGEVQDPRFLRFLEHVSREAAISFTTQDLLVLDLVQRGRPVPEGLRDRLATLRETGVIEVYGRGRGTRYMLSRRFYGFVGKKGLYTQRRGLDRETNKALLLRHIQDNRDVGSHFDELRQVLPTLSRSQIQHLLKELKAESRVHMVGRTRGARWYVGPGPGSIAPKDSSEQAIERNR